MLQLHLKTWRNWLARLPWTEVPLKAMLTHWPCAKGSAVPICAGAELTVKATTLHASCSDCSRCHRTLRPLYPGLKTQIQESRESPPANKHLPGSRWERHAHQVLLCSYGPKDLSLPLSISFLPSSISFLGHYQVRSFTSQAYNMSQTTLD